MQKLLRKEPYSIAELAVMGTAPLAAAKKCRFMHTGQCEIHRAIGQILLDRRPEWLNEWNESQVFHMPWDTLRPLIYAGYLSPATSDRAMQNLMYGLFVDKVPIAETLISRPEWLEGVYRIFNWEPCRTSLLSGATQRARRRLVGGDS